MHGEPVAVRCVSRGHHECTGRPLGHPEAGSALHRSHPEPRARICADRHPGHRAWRGRQHRRVLGRGFRAAPIVAVPRSGHPGAAVRGPAHGRWVGLHEPAVARELSRPQGDELVVRGHGRVRRRCGEPGRWRRAAASRDHAGDARSASPARREASVGARVRVRRRGRQRGRHQLRPVAIAVRRRPRGAGSDDQPQRRPLHDHRRHAADVLLSHPRQAAVDGVDVPRGGLRQSHQQLHRGCRPPQAGRHVRTGPDGARVAGRLAWRAITRRPTRRPASASTACGTTCRRASASC